MQRTLTIRGLLFWTLAAVCFMLPTNRAGAASDESVVDAQRELEIARLRLARFDRVDTALAERKFETHLKLTEAELEMWRHRLEQYESFERHQGNSGFLVTIGETKLQILRLERALDDLKEEHRLVQNNRSDERRLLRLEAEAAVRRLARARGL